MRVRRPQGESFRLVGTRLLVTSDAHKGLGYLSHWQARVGMRTRITVAFVSLVIGLLVSTIALLSARVQGEITTHLMEEMEKTHESLHTFRAQRTEELLVRCRLLADIPLLKATLDTQDPPTVLALLHDYRRYVGKDRLITTDGKGRLLADTQNPATHSAGGKGFLALRGWWGVGAALKGKPWKGMKTEGKRLYVAATSPVKSGATVWGTLTVAEEVDDQVARALGSAAGSQLTFLVNGEIVASGYGEPRRRAALRRVLKSRDGDGAVPVSAGDALRPVVLTLEGQRFVTVADALEEGATLRRGKVCLIQKSLEAAVSPFLRIQRWVVLVGLVALALALLLSYALTRDLTRSITRPLLEIPAVAEKISQGEPASLSVMPPPEFTGLAQAYFSMAEDLYARNTALRRMNDELEIRVQERTAELAQANAELENEIAEHKRTAAALEKAKEIAEAANRAKSEFLADMSREIRTHLTLIVSRTERALNLNLSSEQRESLRAVKSSADALLSIFNDIGDFSTMEAGQLTLEPIEFDLRDSVGDTLKTLAARAHEKGLELAYHIRPDVPDALVGDLSRLRQIIVNLVDNAIKFTERGEVVLRVEKQAQSEDAVHLRFAVSDTGIGIPPDKQQLIFESFTHARKGESRRAKGETGLGLTIARQLVHLMGGRIWVESEVGKGSTFSFTARLGLQTVRTTKPSELLDTAMTITQENRP